MNELRAPVLIQWEITPLCNHKCIHCYNYWREKTKAPIVSPVYKDVDKYYSQTTKEIIKNKIFYVVVTGGEPLTVFNKISPYLKELRKHKIIVSLNTNLTLLTPRMAKIIKDLDICILTSVPSYDPKTTALITNSPTAFLKTQQGIKLAHQYKISVVANMVVTKINLNQIYKTAQYVKSLNIERFGATKACTPINSIDFSDYAITLEETKFMLNELLKVKKKLRLKIDSFIGYPTCLFNSEEMMKSFSHRSCNAGKKSCTISYNGEIRACSHFSKIYGYISEGLNVAWKYMDEWRSNNLTPEQCSKCKLQESCSGGCKVEALTHFGKLNLPDPYADFTNPIDKYCKNNYIYKEIKAKSLKINKKTVFRKEEFGGLLSLDNFIQVNGKLFKFVTEKIDKNITVNDIADALGVSPDKAKLTYSYLAQNNFLVKN